MADITLSAGVRQNLLSLQNTANLMATTQNRLATGKKVNSALDNPTNFFTSQSLQSRANDMASLLDNMTAGIKTLEAADNGLSAITKTIESMQSTMRQARQDRSFKTENYTLNMPASPAGTEVLSFTGGAFGATTETVALTTTGPSTPPVPASLTGVGGTDLSVADPDLSALTGESITITQGANVETYSFTGSATGQKAALLAALNDSGFTVTATAAGLSVSRADGEDFTLTTSNASVDAVVGIADNTTSTNGTPLVPGATIARDLEAIVTAINNDTDLQDKIRASTDNGRLRIENISTQELDITGFNTAGEITGGVSTLSIAGNSVRANLATQYNELRDQLNKLADDASYNGINLLRGDLLKLTFNETGTSTIEIQAKDENDQERPINTSTLGFDAIDEIDLDNEVSIDAVLEDLASGLGVIRSQSSSFGSNLSIVENRTQFTKAMINTLQTGSDSLVLADTNEEAANMLALQTRQQLSSTALSLASQADQAVLRLFG